MSSLFVKVDLEVLWGISNMPGETNTIGRFLPCSFVGPGLFEELFHVVDFRCPSPAFLRLLADSFPSTRLWVDDFLRHYKDLRLKDEIRGKYRPLILKSKH